MRKTKIICTMGPSTDKEGILEQLAIEGMDVARFNFSHGDHEEQKGRLDRLKAIRTKINRPIAALLDTKGPDLTFDSPPVISIIYNGISGLVNSSVTPTITFKGACSMTDRRTSISTSIFVSPFSIRETVTCDTPSFSARAS